MASNTAEIVRPITNNLPDGPTVEPFTDEQWTTLMAIMDTVIPSIHREATTSNKLSQLTISDAEYNQAAAHLQKTVVEAPKGKDLEQYFDEKPSDNPRFQALLKRTIAFYVPEDGRNAFAVILSTLNTRVGSLMLTGSSTPIHQQPIRVREEILQRWRLSYLPPLNTLFKQMTFLGKNIWFKTSPNFNRLAGFPVVPANFKPGSPFDYEFLQFAPGQKPEVIEVDVVIVGSGCGGAVCAKNLAEAGHKVMVVDKGHYFAPSQLPMNEEEGGIHLFESGGLGSTDDGSMPVVAGSTWGGGGTVNWSASLQTQGYVRKEWAEDRGLSFFGTAEFQECLDRVCHRMGVGSDQIRHNHGNLAVLEGSRKLGYTAKAVPQNTAGHEHSCGHCTLGCGAAVKQGPVVTWLPDAARAGAKFVEGLAVQRVLFDESRGTKKAIGVKGTWTSRNSRGGFDGPSSDRIVREVIVKAKKVIISCGTLASPIVLMNSGLKNRQIGRNLYLHPVNFIAGIYKEDVRPWEGAILTSVCTSFEDLDGHGHGIKIESTCMLPSWFLTCMNWDSGLSNKLQALKFRHSNCFFAIARDRDTGRIYPDPVTGAPRVDYTPSAFDRAHLMKGLVAVAKLCYVTGATEIHPCITGVKPFIRDPDTMTSTNSAAPSSVADLGVKDPRFEAWLLEMQRVGNKPPLAAFGCAHQMGSNRMSVRERDGVVDPKGKVWGTEGLYVSDASVFPSASGVNPMVTNMAISDWISRGISKELRTGGSVETRL